MRFLNLLFFLIVLFLSGNTQFDIPIFKVPRFCECAFKTIHFDPINMTNLFSHNAFVNIHSRLLFHDDKEKLVPMLSKSAIWNGDSIEFEFDNNPKTNLGDSITAYDAEKSLLRAMYLFIGNEFLDLKKYICPQKVSKNKKFKCNGVSVVGDKLYIKPIKLDYKNIIFELLTSTYYSIFPRNAISGIEDNFKIINYSNTTGPYSIYMDSPVGEWILVKNMNFKFALDKSPIFVKFVSIKGLSEVEGFELGKTDIITELALGLEKKQIEKLVKNKANLHHGVNGKVNAVFFTRQSVEKYTTSERFSIAKLIKSKYLQQSPYFGQSQTISFFGDNMQGRLSLNQKQLIQKIVQKTLKLDHLKNSFLFPTPEYLMEKRMGLFKNYKQLKLISKPYPTLDLDISERGDVFTSTVHLSMLNTFMDLTRFITGNVFHLPNVDLNKWLEEYTHAADWKSKNLMVQDLHFELLKNAIIVPIYRIPQITITQKNWKINTSYLHDDMELWRLEFAD